MQEKTVKPAVRASTGSNSRFLGKLFNSCSLSSGDSNGVYRKGQRNYIAARITDCNSRFFVKFLWHGLQAWGSSARGCVSVGLCFSQKVEFEILSLHKFFGHWHKCCFWQYHSVLQTLMSEIASHIHERASTTSTISSCVTYAVVSPCSRQFWGNKLSEQTATQRDVTKSFLSPTRFVWLSQTQGV